MGAWIEIFDIPDESVSAGVAPHVGAWIEIVVTECRKYRGLVAPHVGAWIEILVAESPAVMATSHPTWVRGLKFAM